MKILSKKRKVGILTFSDGRKFVHQQEYEVNKSFEECLVKVLEERLSESLTWPVQRLLRWQTMEGLRFLRSGAERGLVFKNGKSKSEKGEMGNGAKERTLSECEYH